MTTTTPARNNKDVSTDPLKSTEYLDALEDVHTRFILNLPESELQTADRIFFQLEQAWWFYEDWICDPDPDCKLPRYGTFKPFAQKLFSYSPLLPDISKFVKMWADFGNYKRKISNYGCILLNQDCTSMILCKIWNSKTYTFPAGKINQGEDGATAAARETYEETGFDPACEFGLTNEWQESAAENNITWSRPLQERDALVFTEDNGKRRTAYVCHGVPADFPFSPVCRKEVAAVEWHPLDNVPKPSYAVMPFLPQLRRWIKKYKNKNNTNVTSVKKPASRSSSKSKSRERGGGRNSNTNSNANSRNSSRGRVIRECDQDALVTAGLVEQVPGQIVTGWSEEDMFQVNERLIGRKVEYDGNPHVFSELGFDGKQDPHAFHVVGGGFLNAATGSTGGVSAGGESTLARPPETSKLQPLFNSEESAARMLQPFFSDGGVTPWGQVVAEAHTTDDINKATTVAVKGAAPSSKKNKNKKESPIDHGKALLATIQGNAGKQQPQSQQQSQQAVSRGGLGGFNDLFLTDAEITAKSQADKTFQPVAAAVVAEAAGTTAAAATVAEKSAHAKRQSRKLQYEQDMVFIQQWVANLAKPKPSKLFGEFKLDADALLAGTPLAMP